MKKTIIITLYILFFSALSFFWMMNGDYTFGFGFLNIMDSDSNFILKLIWFIIAAIIFIAGNLISIIFALLWPFGLLMAIITFLGGSVSSIFSKSDYKSSSKSSTYYNQNQKLNINAKPNSSISSSSFSQNKKSLIPGKKGEFFNNETGKFQKEDWLGLKKDTSNSIDINTGKYQSEDWLGDKFNTGKRIDVNSGEIYKKDFLFGESKTGTRVNQKTGEIEKEGIFGYYKTDERINPETGKRQVKDILGWKNKD